MSDISLYEKLLNYGQSDFYPYHMPGHKRHNETSLLSRIHDIDITEIYDFDNLGNPEGILKTAQDEIAKYCRVKKSYFLVNGSTVGILSAISACVRRGGKLLIARNAHKSTYHAMCIRGIKPIYIYPSLIGETKIFEAVNSYEVEKALSQNNDIDAVIIISPTYEGRVANVKEISDICHKYNIPLIVDEAHGAHLPYAQNVEGYGKSACMSGADIVIQSFHKTLPAPTQTAVMHFNSELIDSATLEKFLHIYQTSSPSYPLMAGIQDAHRFMIEKGEGRLEILRDKFVELVTDINSNCKYIRALPYEAKVQDLGKLVLYSQNAKISGIELASILREDYHLEMEMAGRNYCLAMFTVCDDESAFERIRNAIYEIDNSYNEINNNYNDINIDYNDINIDYNGINEEVIELSKAWEMDGIYINIEDSIGKIANDFISLYPPGTPLLVPGERITDKNISELLQYQKLGYEVNGLDKGMIKVIVNS